MVTEDVANADRFRFVNAKENDDVNQFYIGNVDQRYLAVHASNEKDVRDKRSHYAHIRVNDHKATIWTVEKYMRRVRRGSLDFFSTGSAFIDFCFK